MSLFIAGGYGEHGRNCFLIQGESFHVMIDCGIMNGSDAPYPKLSRTQIQKTKYLFLTHSHSDHTGGISFLYENGFTGTVILSRHTFEQICGKVKKYRFLEEISDWGRTAELEEKLSVLWGKSGHCIGSVWYFITAFRKMYMFSGDYCETSAFYKCDKIRGFSAHTAVIDCAYGRKGNIAQQNSEVLMERLTELYQSKDRVLLPVPKYGRGLDILFLIQKVSNGKADIFADSVLLNPIKNSGEYKEWLNFINIEFQMKEYDNGIAKNGFYLVSDPQLGNQKNAAFAQKLIANHGTVILTGNADKNSFAQRLLQNGQAEYLCYSVHQNTTEAERLTRNNFFDEIFYVHSEEKNF